jgi:hypothetical protein
VDVMVSDVSIFKVVVSLREMLWLGFMILTRGVRTTIAGRETN